MSRPTARTTWLAAALVGALAVAVYLPSLRNDFVWDDPIVLERQLPYFDGPADAFFPPRDVPQWSAHYYRPLVVVSYLLDDLVVRTLYPPEARDAGRRLVFHASPVLLHGVSSALVVALGAALARRFRGQRSTLAVPVAAGLLFAVHPVHVESVAWLAGRSDLLCAAFALAAILAWLRYLETRRAAWLPAAAALALAAMLSKEVGLALVALLPLSALLPGRDAALPGHEAARDAGLAAAVVGFAAAVALALRWAAAAPGPGSAIAWTDPVRTILAALGWYAAKTAWPAPLSAFVDRVPGSVGLAIAGAFVAGGIGALVGASLARRRAGAEAFAAALFLLPLAPALAVSAGTIAATPLAERYLYLPSAGAVLLGALIVGEPRRSARLSFRPTARPAVVLGMAAAIAAVALPATLIRQRAWRDDLAFWSDAAEKAPGGLAGPGRARHGCWSTRVGPRRRRRVSAAHSSWPTRPIDRAQARANLGSLFSRQQRWDDAIAEFRAALADDPGLDTAHANLAQALLARYAAQPVPAEKPAVMAEAAGHFDAARRIDPRKASLHFAYGMLMIELGRPAEAAAPLREVIALAPESPEAATARRALEPLGAR